MSSWVMVVQSQRTQYISSGVVPMSTPFIRIPNTNDSIVSMPRCHGDSLLGSNRIH